MLHLRMRAGRPLVDHVTPDLTNLATRVKSPVNFTPSKHAYGRWVSATRAGFLVLRVS
jgi:hypothetical protein